MISESEVGVHLENLKIWNLEWLEAKVKYGLAFELIRDFFETGQNLSVANSKRHILNLLEEALRRDIHFIARHSKEYPQALFQSLWNSCWWYDCPNAKRHYDVQEDWSP